MQTRITVSGVAAGACVVFLPAGDDTCDGAALSYSLSGAGDKAGEQLDADLRVTVLLQDTVVHKACAAPGGAAPPSHDAQFYLLVGCLLEVIDWSPPDS